MKTAIAVITAVTLLMACRMGSSDQNTATYTNPDIDSRHLSTLPFVPCDDVDNHHRCDNRDVSGYTPFSPDERGARSHEPYEPSVEEILEQGLRLADASPVQLAVRGMASADSVRCQWRGIARTQSQRQDAIRFWLGLGPEDVVPDTAAMEALFTATFTVVDGAFKETAMANFLAIARGGEANDYLFLTCFASYTVQEYLLGAGSSEIILSYDRMGEAHSYDLYRLEHDYGSFGDEPLMSEGEYEAHLDEMVMESEAALAEMIGNRESVVFLAPMGAHNAIAVEAWQAVEQWDLQMDDEGVVHAVRYGVPEGDPEQTQTLANLKTRITTAAASDAFADDRIANASGLTQYYRDIGAYDDITPDDGSTDTFTPAQPPAPYTCANGTAVTTPSDNRALVHDCEALLESKDTLRGAATLDWTETSAITGWEGITTSGTPSRVTELDLSSESLSGAIPAIPWQFVRTGGAGPEQQLPYGADTPRAGLAVQPGRAKA